MSGNQAAFEKGQNMANESLGMDSNLWGYIVIKIRISKESE